MLYSAILTQIKAEAILASSTQYDTLIELLLNEELAQLCSKDFFSDLLVPDHDIVCTADQNYVDFPTDLIRLKPDSVYLLQQDGETYRQLKQRPLAQRTRYNADFTGEPTFYFIANRRIYFWPTDDITTDNEIRISYYKKISVSSPSDIVPDILCPTVIQNVIARLMVSKNAKQAGFHLGKGREHQNTAISNR